MALLVLARETGGPRQERPHTAEQPCLVSGQRAALEDAARQQARRQARVYGWRAAVASLAATALLLGGYALGLVCL
jgi:hypothetical protein